MAGALSNIRVLDLADVLAGGFASTMLADFGADMIKIEPREGGYGWQLVKSRPVEVRQLAAWCRRRNRRAITLNLASDKGKEIFLELVKTSDVVIQNFRRPVMDRLGLGYDVLKKANPQIIYCALSGYGQTGPYRDKMAYDPTIQAAAGVMSMTGFDDKPPVRAGLQLADYVGAVYSVLGILLALNYRNATGKGQMVDVAMFDAMCHWTLGEVGAFAMGGGKRMGNKNPWAVPMNTYLTKDGQYLLMGAQTDKQWAGFLKAIGKNDILEEKWSFNTRLQRKSEIDVWAADWVRTKTLEEAEVAFTEADLACARIANILDLPDDPQVLIRELLHEVDDPECGKLPGVLGIVPKLSETPGEIKGVPPKLGEHNEEVLCGVLGYSKDELTKLKEDGVV
jgi:crotonobetainyl-CoA:carnitine CoA-transferase CaiB-like acyl-CoA transferase